MSKQLYKHITIICFLLAGVSLFGQHENVSVDHDVYTFLKEMKVKKIIADVHDDNPGMSRYEISKHLALIDSSKSLLSATEKKLLNKFQNEFYDEQADGNNSMQFFGSSAGYSKEFSDLFTDKLKYTYAFRREKVNYYFEILGRIFYGQTFKPTINNSELYDIGFRMRGTLFNNLGYSLTVQKGGVSGSQDTAPIFEPRLLYNFKFIEKLENIGNYDFTEGYLRYYSEPIDNMGIAFQIGREKIKLGYGYGDRLVMTGNHPVLDFLKLDFNYGMFGFTSLTASTVGEFHINRVDNYTKYYAYNRFKLKFENAVNIGLGEAVVYSNRGLDLAYLNPFAFYKFEEMSLQDRDNAVLFLDFQTSFMKNLELQGTFFLDENILSHLQELDLYSNKTAYQLGAFWYEPLSISDLSFKFEYTKIRPYVYSHINFMNSYTSFAQNLGHRIGPNADEIHFSAAYNYSEKLRLAFEYQSVRSGENIYDGQGNLVFNAGGDYLAGHREAIDPHYINFLDGERTNQNIFTFSFRYEPIREFYFDLLYKYIWARDLTIEKNYDSSYGYIKLTFEL